MLDYAEITAEKFHKNIAPFNIRETVAKVIKLQKKKADDKGLALSADFVNISATEEHTSKENTHSPIMVSDESRITQVLLGLQSNALKFTEKG